LISSTEKKLRFLGMLWLFSLGFFLWGVATVELKIFPYQVIKSTYKEIEAFVKGDPADNRPIWKRYWTQVTVYPFAFDITPKPFPVEINLSPVDTTAYEGPEIKYLDKNQYYSDSNLNGYFLIYGSFAFENSNWGAILISTGGQVLRGWPIKPDNFDYKLAHIGMAVSENGNIATNTNGVLSSYSWCGNKDWEAEWKKQPERYSHDHVKGYDYHHDISFYDGKFYTFRGPVILSIDETTGKVVDRIHVLDMIRWAREQDLAIFDARFTRYYKANELDLNKFAEIAVSDPFHFNKVDVLSRELAPSFDGFEEGDMLVSMRELNLVFVMRPKESKILWYRYGLTSRQHDATFQRGYIAVFDNNPFSNSGRSPRIMRLEINDHSRSVLFDLRKWGAKNMQVKGNFELDDDTHILMFSDDDNGRAVIGDLSGRPMFVFENSVDQKKNLELRNITYISPEKFEKWSSHCK